ncbi:MAG TPA: serine/threonine-protein kinase [Polyangia bacterium]|jgi:serine/threonine protein kinase
MALAGLKDRFEILGEIGEGGFARVYKARETATQRRVALKVLKDAYLHDPEIVERFRREVFAVASISSPHVVGMYDFGISGRDVFIAMEFVEGTTLRELIYDRSWPARDTHLIIGQIAQALAAAHRQNIVHRDLKPENVMLVPAADGARQVKVLDFGLAKIAELERKLDLEPLTRAGMCFGTPQYMAPELVQGKPYDKSVDLYALGVIAFEMIAGYLPWDGADPREVLLAVVKNPPPHLKQAHPSVTRVAELDKFLQRAISKDRGARASDAAAFFRDFEQALFGEKQPARSKSLPRADAPFASVWAQAIELRTEGEDATQVDAGNRFAVELTGGFGGVTKSGTRRRLQSGWMKSLARVDTVGDPLDLATTLPVGTKAPANHQSFRARPSERTDQIAQRPSRSRDLVKWLLPLLVGLAIVATALGYFLGRQSMK